MQLRLHDARHQDGPLLPGRSRNATSSRTRPRCCGARTRTATGSKSSPSRRWSTCPPAWCSCLTCPAYAAPRCPISSPIGKICTRADSTHGGARGWRRMSNVRARAAAGRRAGPDLEEFYGRRGRGGGESAMPRSSRARRARSRCPRRRGGAGGARVRADDARQARRTAHSTKSWGSIAGDVMLMRNFLSIRLSLDSDVSLDPHACVCASRAPPRFSPRVSARMWTCVRPGLVGAAPRANPRRRPGTRVPIGARARVVGTAPRVRRHHLATPRRLLRSSLWLATPRGRGRRIAPARRAGRRAAGRRRSRRADARETRGPASRGTPLFGSRAPERRDVRARPLERARTPTRARRASRFRARQGVAGDTTTPRAGTSASTPEAGAGA